MAEWLPQRETVTKGSDLTYVEEYSACREAIDGVATQIEVGLISGGFTGWHRAPAVHAVWWTTFAGPLASLDGGADDIIGQKELLAIVRTVRLHKIAGQRR
jgi:hypothetical protein